MKRVALGLGIATVALLNVILASGNGTTRGAAFHTAIELLPWTMIPSSALFAYLFFRSGHRSLATLFALNVGAILVVVGTLLLGGRPTERALFVADVLQLNLYLVALTAHWPLLVRRMPVERRVAAEL